MTNYELQNNNITQLEEEKQIKEENKLSITELGVKVSEFCNTYFQPLFDYRFTERMEKELDLIEEGKDWKQIVKYFIGEVDKLLTLSQEILNDTNTLKKEYKSLHCGTYNKNAVVLKDGPYGFYIEYKKESISLQKFKPPEIINEWIVKQELPNDVLNEMIEYIQNKKGYVISQNISIRYGPKGYYIFYKKANMKKPKFYGCTEILELIEQHDTDKIVTYVEKKYNII